MLNVCVLHVCAFVCVTVCLLCALLCNHDHRLLTDIQCEIHDVIGSLMDPQTTE